MQSNPRTTERCARSAGDFGSALATSPELLRFADEAAAASDAAPPEARKQLCLTSLRSVAEDVHRNLPRLQSHPFRARQLWRVHRNIACNLFACARLLDTTKGAAAQPSLLAGGLRSPWRPAAVLAADRRARRSSALRCLLSALLRAEDFLLTRGASIAAVHVAFRSARIRVLDSFGFELGSILRVLPRMARDTGVNTDEVGAKRSPCDFEIRPNPQTYATAEVLQRLFGHHASGKAYIALTRSAEKTLEPSGALPAARRGLSWAPEAWDGDRTSWDTMHFSSPSQPCGRDD